jgi:lysophospholipase L1-like esterase
MPAALERLHNQAIRLIVHTSIGGKRARIRIANTYGDTALVIGAAHVARRTEGAHIDQASDRLLMFGGRPSVTVPSGAAVLSDPVAFEVPALSDLAISLYFPTDAVGTTAHFLAMQTNYVAPATGDASGASDFPVARTIESWPFLAGVDVETAASGFAVVMFGDSTIDGDGSTEDANQRVSDVLAERLQKARMLETGVLNEGVIGNRLLHGSPAKSRKQFGDVFGPSALARFDRDVVDQAGVRYLIVRIGINDIGFAGTFASEDETPSAQQMISGYRELIARARVKGIHVIGTTLAPFAGAKVAPGYFGPAKEILRRRINKWIRRSGEFDAVIDADAVLRDPSRPARLLGAYDSGDHLHTNDAGYAATGNAIPLTLFR